MPEVPYLTLSGAVGSFKLPKVMAHPREVIPRAQHTSAASGKHVIGRAQNLPPGEPGQAPRLARAKTYAAHIEPPKSNR